MKLQKNTWGRLVKSDDGSVEILLELKSSSRRSGKLFWKVLEQGGILKYSPSNCQLKSICHIMIFAKGWVLKRKWDPIQILQISHDRLWIGRNTKLCDHNTTKEIFAMTNLGRRGKEFLAKLRTVREEERKERSSSSAFSTSGLAFVRCYQNQFGNHFYNKSFAMSSWPGVEGCHWERGGQVWNEDDEKIRREKM